MYFVNNKKQLQTTKQTYTPNFSKKSRIIDNVKNSSHCAITLNEVKYIIDYLNLKNSYITAIQMGLDLGFSNPKQGNELLHDFCKKLIDNSNYSMSEKQKMKNELDLVKETLSLEIESRLPTEIIIDPNNR